MTDVLKTSHDNGENADRMHNQLYRLDSASEVQTESFSLVLSGWLYLWSIVVKGRIALSLVEFAQTFQDR